MKELEQYLIEHLPIVCNYAIVYTGKTSVELIPVPDKEKFVMLKLQGEVHSTYDYNALVDICKRGFLRKDIHKLKNPLYVIDPLADLTRQIELGLVLDDMDPVRDRYITVTMPKVRPVDQVTTYGMSSGVDAIFEATYGTKAPRIEEDSEE